jgi:proteasome accessory factor B
MNKSERLLNLLILLLVQERFVSKQRIRESIEEYAGQSTEAFERMFERDKDELRALGVPIEVGNADAFFDDEPGYRIRKDEAFLPDIELTADEAAVVGLATRVWQHAGMAAHTTDALAKLTAAGVSVDRTRLDLAAPAISADDPSFEVIWQASLDKAVVTFDYRRSGSAEVTHRTLEPWGVVFFSGRWYVVGRDVQRDDARVFRLSRVVGGVTRKGKANAYTIPPGTDLRELTRRLSPARPTQTATVLVRTDSCHGMRRRAESVESGVEGPDDRTGWDRIRLPFSTTSSLVEDVLSFGADAVLETPEPARAELVTRLEKTVGASG